MSAQYDGSIKFDTKIDSDKFEKEVSNLKKVAIASATGIGVALAGAAIKGGKYALSLASDLQEVQNVVDVTFGSNADKIETWAKNAGKNFGMAELAAKQYTGTMGAMLKSMGLNDDAVLKMSTDLTGLAGDFASFYNLDHSAAFDKIRAGISGETEPLKQLGINMSVANLEAYALSQGIKTAYKDMSQAEQATLRYNYILQAGADAQGDFARTSDSFANQLRIAQLSVTEIASSIGEKLLPIATGAMQGVNSGLTWLSETVAGHKSELDGLIETVNEQKAAYDALVIAEEEKAVSALAEVENTRRLKDELMRLADEKGHVEDADKARVSYILGELNSAYGTEYQLIQNQITGYENLGSTIDTLIAKKRASILLDSAEATYKEAVNGITSALESQSGIYAQLTQKKNELVVATDKVRKGDVAYNATVLKLQEEIGNLQKEYERQTATVQQYSTDIQAYEDAAAAATEGRVNDVISSLDKMGAAQSQAADKATQTAEEQKQAYANAFVDAVLAADVAAENYKNNSNEFNKQALEDAKAKAETAKKEFEAIGGQIIDGMVVGIDASRSNLRASVSTLLSEIPLWARTIMGIASPSKVMAKDVGKWVPLGVATGIDDNANAVIDSAVNMVRSGISAARKELDINSPSGIAKDDIGKWIPLGVAKGIEENSDAVIKSFNAVFDHLEYNRKFDIIGDEQYYTELEKYRDKYLKKGSKEWLDYTLEIYDYQKTSAKEAQDKELRDLKYKCDVGEITEAEYYAQLEKYRDKYFEVGSDEWQQYTVEIHNYQQRLHDEAEKAAKEARDKELRDLKYKCDVGEITEAEYYAQLEKYRDKYFEVGSDEWQQYTVDIYNYQQKLLENEKKLLEEQKSETKQMYDDIVNYALDKLGEIEKKQESYSKKLSSYGTLFTHSTIEFGEETIEYYSLADIDKDISAISAYNEKMVAFKNSLSDIGISEKTANAYLEEINNLSVDEGTKVLDALLKTDTGKLGEYLGEYEKKLVYSEGAAATYYYDDMANAVADSYQNMVNKLTEAGFEVPEGWITSGTLSAKNFGEAFITEIDNQLAQIGTKIDGYLYKFQALRAYGINDNAGTVYQDNRKSDTVIVVQSEQQAIETKRQNDIYEQHTKGW